MKAGFGPGCEVMLTVSSSWVWDAFQKQGQAALTNGLCRRGEQKKRMYYEF